MIPYTYKMVDLGGLDITDIIGQEFSGLYQKIQQAIATGEVIIIYNWYVAGIKIPPTYVEIEVGSGYYLINDLIYINSDDTISIPTMTIPSIIQSLSVSENGTYNVPSGVDGFNPVVVMVPPPVIQALSASENGTYNVPTGVDGYNPVVVNVPGPVIQQLNVDENGTYNPGSGVDGFSPVVVNIPQKVLVQLTVTENGTYLPASYDADGFSSVVVNVQGAPSPEEPLNFDVSSGYVGGGSWWFYSPDSGCYSDVYEVVSGHRYFICLGQQVSTRFRCLFTTSNPALATSNVNGNGIGSDQDPPPSNAFNQIVYVPSSNGFITVGKSNDNTSGIKSYCWDLTKLGISPPTT